MEIAQVDDTCNNKIHQLEIAKVLHEQRLNTQEQKLETQGLALDKITGLLSQVRWMAAGALSVYLGQQLGLESLLKTVFSILIGA